MTLEERFAHTVPVFQLRIQRIAAVAAMQPLEVFALWREYSDYCSNCDQSALLWEFVEWYAEKLGGDRAALHKAEAVNDES